MKMEFSLQNDGDFEKLLNNCYIESDEDRAKCLELLNNMEDVYKKELVEKYSDMVEIGEVKSINENKAKVKVKGVDLGSLFGSSSGQTIKVIKVNGRWFLTENPF